jgi:hypothetical protein
MWINAPIALLKSRDFIVWPWCAQYRGPDGPVDCGFVTFEQRLATVGGVGGFCEKIMHISPQGSPGREHAEREVHCDEGHHLEGGPL